MLGWRSSARSTCASPSSGSSEQVQKQPSARGGKRHGAVDQPRLQLHQRPEGCRRLGVRQVGMPADRARGRTGRVEQHGVEVAPVPIRRVGDDVSAASRSQRARFSRAAHPRVRDVERRDIGARRRQSAASCRPARRRGPAPARPDAAPRSARAAPRRRPAPTIARRHSPAGALTCPGSVRRTLPVGSTSPPVAAAIASGSPSRGVRSSGAPAA